MSSVATPAVSPMRAGSMRYTSCLQPRVRREGFSLLLVLTGLALWIGFKAYTGILLEDALITFRYAENLATGGGFAYNRGEPVLGTTTPLFTLMLAAGALLLGTNAIPTIALVGSLAATAASAILIVTLIERAGRDRLVALCGAALFCAHPTTLWMTTGGMETPFVVLMMAGSVAALAAERVALAAAIGALLVILRIDGAIWTLLLALLAGPRKFRNRELIVAATVGGVLLAGWALFACAYFGSPIPQSVSAKQAIGYTSDIRAYIRWVIQALGVQGPLSVVWLVCVTVESVAVLRTGPKSFLLPMVLYPPLLCGAYWLGNAPLEFPWYAVPVTFCGLVLGVCGADRLIRTWYRAMHGTAARFAGTAVAAVLACALFVDLIHRDYWTFVTERANQENEDGLRRRAGEWLAIATPPHATVAMEAIGYIGTYSHRKVLDLAGLISPPVVDLYRSAPSHAVGFERVLRSMCPDYLVLRSFEVDGNQHYHGGPLFETSQQRSTFEQLYQEVVRFRAPHQELWGRLGSLTVYKRTSVTNCCVRSRLLSLQGLGAAGRRHSDDLHHVVNASRRGRAVTVGGWSVREPPVRVIEGSEEFVSNVRHPGQGLDPGCKRTEHLGPLSGATDDNRRALHDARFLLHAT
jgi:arabinofuranosyltransferase